MKELMAAALSPNAELGVGVAASYVIRDFSKGGESEFRAFIDEIDRTIGTHKRDRLMSGYSVFSSYFNYGYSRTIINIMAEDPEQLGAPTDPRVQIFRFDPISSRQRVSTSTSLRGFNDNYDNLLSDVPHG